MAATSEGEQRALSSHALKSQSRDRLSAMEFLARDRLAVKADTLDRDPWLLNVNNGTIDLRSGELGPHRREDLITRICPVDYDPNASCPRWIRFLEEVLPDSAVRIFVQRWLGHGTTGDVREQYLPIFWGDGNNGKSVLLDTVSAVLGSYAAEAPPDLLTSGAGGGDHPTDIADLMGRRFVVASETEAYARLRIQLVKRLTGNAKLKGRYMRQDFFEFDRTHKLVLATNNKPEIPETTEAVWRRIRLVHFGVVIPGPRVDKSLMSKLRAEYAGILAWLVHGAVDWLREGLTEPEAIMRATAEYRHKSDSFGEFVEEHLRIEPDAFSASDDVRKTYEGFCKGLGIEAISSTQLRDKIFSLGARPGKTMTKRGYVGIRLL
jgi:putative DNA primase/helicase